MGIETAASAALPVLVGSTQVEAVVSGFVDPETGGEYVVLAFGDAPAGERTTAGPDPLSGCLTGDVLGSLRCDCRRTTGLQPWTSIATTWAAAW